MLPQFIGAQIKTIYFAKKNILVSVALLENDPLFCIHIGYYKIIFI